MDHPGFEPPRILLHLQHIVYAEVFRIPRNKEKSPANTKAGCWFEPQAETGEDFPPFPRNSDTLQHNVVTVYSSRDPWHYDLRGGDWLEKEKNTLELLSDRKSSTSKRSSSSRSRSAGSFGSEA